MVFRWSSKDEYRDVLGSCLEETLRLSKPISDLFLARAESLLAHLHWGRVDMRELLTGVRDYYEGMAAEGGISLSTANGDQPVIAEVDRTLVQRAAGNLVANAVAHTPPGGSVVLRTNADSGSVRIEVSDTGVGIPPEALPRVFDRFFCVDEWRSQASAPAWAWPLCKASWCFTTEARKFRATQDTALDSHYACPQSCLDEETESCKQERN
jgi:two-component system, OmpR family, heavy metal sensor histidine kinase CusS